MPVLRYFSSIATPAALTSNINAVTTSVAVDTVIGFPTNYPYTLALDWGTAAEELVDVLSAAGTTLTVTRGVDGTSAQSHGVGAPVRHVASGRDFADYQNHQAASSGVHGVVGTVVGTSDTQSLSNKTLTAAVLSGGGSISGTWSGTPTFSGAVTFSAGGNLGTAQTWSGTPNFTGAHTHTSSIAVTRANASDLAYAALVTGDANGRFNLQAGGRMEWGDGTAARDAFFYRDAAQVLRNDDTLIRGNRTVSTNGVFSARITGDASARWTARGDGALVWGNGTLAGDTNLYRSAVGTLKTDTSFETGAYMFAGQSIALTGTPTAASGWTLTSAVGFKSGGVTTWFMLLARTGADITANSAGNIADQDVATVPGDWRPPSALLGASFMPTVFSATVTGGTLGLSAGGTVRLHDMHANSTISTGDSIRFHFSFVNVDDIP